MSRDPMELKAAPLREAQAWLHQHGYTDLADMLADVIDENERAADHLLFAHAINPKTDDPDELARLHLEAHFGD